MKLFLMEWVGKDLGFVEIAKKLKNEGHEIAYWSGPDLDSEVNKSLFPGTIFHEYSDALSLISPREMGFDFPPPGKDLLDKLYDAESAVLTMMNKKFEKLSVSERKHLYYHYVRYWHGVLEKLKPDAILFPVVPHTVYDFIVYGIAKTLKIKTIFFMLTRIGDRILAMEDFESGSGHIEKFMAENYLPAGRQAAKKITAEDLAPDIREYYFKEIAAPAKLDLPDVKFQQNQYSYKNLLILKAKVLKNSIRDFKFFGKLFSFLKNRFGDNLKKEYLRLQVKPDLDKKFIYVPLNYQPESTTSPLGGVFVDQLLMLEVLAASIPPDWRIYVKEYPLQWKPRGISYSCYRYRGFYSAISRLKNTYLVPLDANTYDLIRKSQAVATVNGTAGWEAVLRFKPSLIFGHAWYRDCPGVFPIGGAEDCKKIIQKIQNGDFKNDRQNILNYLAAFEGASIRGYTDIYLKGAVKISVEESAENYFRAIISIL